MTPRLGYLTVCSMDWPRTPINKLQRVQHTEAWIVTQTSHCSHLNPVLKDLHCTRIKTYTNMLQDIFDMLIIYKQKEHYHEIDK